VLAGFLELHAADPIAQAITTHLAPAEVGRSNAQIIDPRRRDHTARAPRDGS
jgi:hypothetical protein